MMLTKRYMVSVKNLPDIMKQIVEGVAPKKFNLAHLKGLGFKSSNDFAAIPILKDLGFLSPDGTPTQRYNDYRDPSRSRQVLGQALREMYEDLFHINERLEETHRQAIKGKFISQHNASEPVAELQTRTFLALLKLADVSKSKPAAKEEPERKEPAPASDPIKKSFGGLHYNIEIHLPATKDIDVFNAIFKSLKEHIIG